MANINSLLDLNQIQQAVEIDLKQKFEWRYHSQIESTNDDLLKLGQANTISLTEFQTQGKGQRQNQWEAKHSQDCLFSIAIRLHSFESITLIPLKIALAIINVLDRYKLNGISVKWPNDVYYFSKKIAGILIETQMQGDNLLAVVGVGLNVNSQHDDFSERYSLNQITHTVFDRSELLTQLITEIYRVLLDNKTSKNKWIDRFNQRHLYHQQDIDISLLEQNKMLSGVCEGINELGALILSHSNQLKEITCGRIIQRSALFIDGGNSAIKCHSELGFKCFNCDESDFKTDFTQYLQKHSNKTKVFISLVSSTKIKLFIKQQLKATFIHLVKEVKASPAYQQLINAYDDYNQLGVDRWLCLIAAQQLKGDKVIIDAGTWIKMDALLDNHRHLGGAIISKNKNDHMRLCKKLNFQVNTEIDVDFAFGRSTAQCCLLGQNRYDIDAVNFLLNLWLDKLKDKVKVIITGGDAVRVKRSIENNIQLDKGRIDILLKPNLVLSGLYHYHPQK